MSDSEATTAAIQEAYAWRPIDVLVCNAGVVFPGHFDEVSITQLDDAMKINVMGSVYPVHAALPLMKQRNLSNPCSIVFLSSIAGMVIIFPSLDNKIAHYELCLILLMKIVVTTGFHHC